MSLRREILWGIALAAALTILFLYMEPAAATGNWWDHDHPHEHPTVNGVDGQDGIDGVDGMNGNQYNSGMAAVMAADAIHCTTSSRKNQMGVGGGWSDGHSGFAVGYCHSLEFQNQPVLLGVKAAGATDSKPKYSIGLNWTW